MKRLNKFPRKLRNYTCIALVVGVLGWSGSGVGEDYHVNRIGQAFEGAGPTGTYSFSTLPSTGGSQIINKKNNNNDLLTNPVQTPSAESGDSQATGTDGKNLNAGNDSSKGNIANPPDASGDDGQGFAPPIVAPGSACDIHDECKRKIKDGADYEGFCCPNRPDGDAIGRKGFCVDSQKTCEGMNGSPDGDKPDSSDPNPPSNPGDGDNSGGDNGGFICKEDSDCKNYDCDPDGNDNIVWPACNRGTGQCYCKGLQKYECRDNTDCQTWWSKPQRDRSTGCDSASNFKCEGATDFEYGQCVCQRGDQSTGGNSCEGKNCGDKCTGCNETVGVAGGCACVKNGSGLTCQFTDMPKCQ